MNEDIIRLAQEERDKFFTHAMPVGKSHQSLSMSDRNYSPLLTLEDVFSQQDIPEEWVVNSVVLQNGITTISGLPNHFKSFFVQMLVKHVASGIPFLGKFPVSQGKILVIDREVPTIRLKKRWGSIQAGDNKNIFFYRFGDPFKLDNIQDVQHLEKLIDEYNFKLIVIDTFNRAHSGKDTNSYTEVASVFEPLKKIIEKTSIILVHHSNKAGYKNDKPTPEELMGSTDFLAEIDLLFTIRKTENNQLTVHNLKAKDSPVIEPFVLQLVTQTDGSLDLQYKGAFSNPMSPKELRSREIIDYLSTGKKMKSEVISHMTEKGEKEGTINNILTELRNRRIVTSELVNKEACYFLLENYRQEQERFPPLPELGFGNQGNVNKPCYMCGGVTYWTRADGEQVCSACHPPG